MPYTEKPEGVQILLKVGAVALLVENLMVGTNAMRDYVTMALRNIALSSSDVQVYLAKDTPALDSLLYLMRSSKTTPSVKFNSAECVGVVLSNPLLAGFIRSSGHLDQLVQLCHLDLGLPTMLAVREAACVVCVCGRWRVCVCGRWRVCGCGWGWGWGGECGCGCDHPRLRMWCACGGCRSQRCKPCLRPRLVTTP